MLTCSCRNVNLRDFKWLIMCYLIKSSSFAFPFHFAEIPRNEVDSIWLIAFSVIFGVMPMYFIVVATLWWPKILLTLKTLTPSSIRWVASEVRASVAFHLTLAICLLSLGAYSHSGFLDTPLGWANYLLFLSLISDLAWL